MQPRAVGGQWLKDRFNLVNYTMTHASYISGGTDVRVTSKGNIERDFVAKYDVGDPTNPLEHMEFYLKYDDFSLDFIQAVLKRIPEEEILEFIEFSPAGELPRKIGYLYEWLTGRTLAVTKQIGGNYIDLLDTEKYVTGDIKKNARWRINDNLLGGSMYCPVVRKTPELKELLKEDLSLKIAELKKSFPDDIFTRAINYLYTKETRSSYEIEKEKPSADRTQKFVTLLKQAGAESDIDMLSEERLVQLQNAIVDSRFGVKSFRDFQDYVGESISLGEEYIHYICPPPSMVTGVMEGLKKVALKTQSVPAEVRCGILSFGFVFIHPFDDGNGRIHRFLIHDLLTQGKIVPAGIIIPVSAHMLNHKKEYDTTLEKYSTRLMNRIKYSRDGHGELTITNEADIEGYFRYPDLTDQCLYLVRAIHETIEEEMPEELTFILRFDEAKKAIQEIVDMPDKMITQMLKYLHQNKGVLAKKRRAEFSKLTDEEIEFMQEAYKIIYFPDETDNSPE
ncbi:Fic/DOC family protein [Chitinophaga eiseniae]|uniref:Fic/DOC family protein n=1 Tax=Chitinophaga eiseniae TaxID=634771 RepID=A0A1T4PTH4_9BACT|nr:Fic family protein [Chitinophaga eiseniae]SJZ94964.1 Fic/DOC family protein [Chitinophaga eiseniae]